MPLHLYERNEHDTVISDQATGAAERSRHTLHFWTRRR